MNAQERLITALDFKTQQQAENMIEQLGDSITFYKVGLELFLNSRGLILESLAQQKKRVFLDLKFHDIPNTCGAASGFAASLDTVDMFNVHASGGKEMIAASAKAKRTNQILLAVTILTSLDTNDIQTLFNSRFTLSELTLNLACHAQSAGADGVVCSALEAGLIKEKCGSQFITVCPGIRTDDSDSCDQKRILTPKEAIKNGADYLVIGRPITAASSPKKAAEDILEQIAKA